MLCVGGCPYTSGEHPKLDRKSAKLKGIKYELQSCAVQVHETFHQDVNVDQM